MEEQVPVYRIEVLLLTNDALVAVPLVTYESEGFIEGCQSCVHEMEDWNTEKGPDKHLC